MIPIIICGEPDIYQHGLVSELCESLKGYGSTLVYTKVTHKGCTFDELNISREYVPLKFIIYELQNIPLVSGGRAILIFKNSFKSKIAPIKLSGLIPIIYEQNKEAISALKGTGASVISCGMSTYNTLSIASRDYNSAIVSVQRQIKTLTNHIIEPHDFPLYFNKSIDMFNLLISSAILLLADIDSSEGYNL